MIDQMLMRRTSFDRFMSFLAIVLMAATAASIALLTVGAITGSHSFTKFGALLSLPAMVWAAIPLLCGGLLLLIWGGRSIGHMLGSPTSALIATEIVDPTLPASEEGLSDEEILARLPIDGSSGTLPAPITTVHIPNFSRTASEVEKLKSEAHRHNVSVVELSKSTYLVEPPTVASTWEPGSSFEQLCLAFLNARTSVKQLVIDVRSLARDLLKKFCGFIRRLMERISQLDGRLRVVPPESMAVDQLIEGVWAYVEGSVKIASQRLFVLSLLQNVFLGLPGTKHAV